MSRRRIIAWSVIAGAGAVVLEQFVPSLAGPPSAPAPAERQAAPAASPALEGLASLPVREPIAPPRGQIFGPRSWDTPPAVQPGRRGIVKRSAPPMPYRVAGQVTHEGGMRVVLAKGDRVYLVHEGETLEDGYRVESIRPDAVILVYLPLALRERLEVSGAALQLDDARRAQVDEESQAMHAASGSTVAR